jgi:hypothetical protein
LDSKETKDLDKDYELAVLYAEDARSLRYKCKRLELSQPFLYKQSELTDGMKHVGGMHSAHVFHV